MSPGPRDAARLWVRLAKVYGLMLRRVRQEQSRRDMTLAQFDVAAQLLRRPEGMTAGELSRELLVTAGNVTGLVTRMEERGWLTRTACSQDARVRRVRLTAAGRRLASREVERHELLLEEILGGLTRTERRDLSRSLDRMRDCLQREPTEYQEAT